MRIDYTALEAIKQLNLPEIVRSYGIELKETQRESFSGLCPFHNDKNPSLYINKKNGKWLWNCFGCRQGGNVIDFVIKYEKIQFADAYNKLLSLTSNAVAHCVNEEPSKPVIENKSAWNKAELLKRVTAFYHQTFFEDKRAAEYLSGRGIRGEEIYKAFSIGFANGSLKNTLPTNADNELLRTLQEIGILNQRGTEHFYGCAVFPIYDESGNIVQLYGRKISDQDGPNHLYLPAPHKGVWNLPAIKAGGEIIITESIIDAASCYMLGARNAVPLYGVNGLTEDHLNAFKEYRTQKIRLCFDNDATGNDARQRIKEKIGSLGIDITDVFLPFKYKDINEALQNGFTAEELKQIINPQPLVKNASPKQSPAGVAETIEEYPKIERQEGDIYIKFAERHYRIRGLEAKNLERMRVTIKVQHGENYHLDSLDLYSSKSRSLFCGQCKKVMKADESELLYEINRIIHELEKIQTASIDIKTSEPQQPVMSASEKSEALEGLQSPTLISDILCDLSEMGYVGENANKAIGYLVAVSRKLEDPLSCVIISQSSAGKSALADVIEKLVPPEECLLYSRITPQALYYMDKGALKRKLLMIEESVGADSADYSIRTLQSKKKLTQAVPIKDPNTGRIRTVSFEVEGPIAYIETTTRPRINQENATRCFELYLDESKEQTHRIQEAQKESKTLSGLRKKEERERIIRKHQNMQRLLREVRVVTPFAHLLNFPTQWLRTRRDNLRFLNLIEAVTFLHQYQRQIRQTEDGSEYIESTIDDYKTAYLLAREVLGESFTELKKPQRELLQQIEKLASEKEEELTRRQIREYTGLPDYRLRDLLAELVSLEYLQVIEGRQGKSYHYQLAERAIISGKIVEGLTHPDELIRKIGKMAVVC
jgi:DNA primase catalytic core